jgi:hypothetical protein
LLVVGHTRRGTRSRGAERNRNRGRTIDWCARLPDQEICSISSTVSGVTSRLTIPFRTDVRNASKSTAATQPVKPSDGSPTAGGLGHPAFRCRGDSGATGTARFVPGGMSSSSRRRSETAASGRESDPHRSSIGTTMSTPASTARACTATMWPGRRRPTPVQASASNRTDETHKPTQRLGMTVGPLVANTLGQRSLFRCVRADGASSWCGALRVWPCRLPR